ncbi:flagellar M-ring protein FliF [Salibacterium salarium]|uniref:flagellar basal-body MS-ring/collar protein FliF n=1 Tax=Salibacterium salarium TaxID=284579 RepID=UPI00277FE1A6|nr:flagellar basal-body MS-ring/collar protein FliF [Salibacterium salarium]MDQ0299129.1 flagellar M-ring protein FliF [Salibacterium salarium]
MKEKFLQFRDKTKEYWRKRTKGQKSLIVGFIVLFVLIIFFTFYFGSRTNYAPLYSDLSPEETGQIKETLDSRGIPSELTNGGSTIRVPETQVNSLKVELAAEGLPDSGSIDYSFIEDQMGFGMTDSEFNTMERAAMQTELGKLIQNIDGVEAANVMITLPEESTWVAEEDEGASASVVIDTGGTTNMEQTQVRALYHLVSKSVPDLSVDNIVIMNEMFEHFDYESQNNSNSTMNAYEEQRNVQDDIEKDIQSQLQQMLGKMMGMDKVVVSVSSDIDFTQETREEALVEPVDEENMEGIEVSAERIEEAYEGQVPEDGGVAGTGEEDVANYPAGAATGDGDYEREEERINYEVNRIHREIVESPYKIRDLGIQVMVEPPEPENEDSLDPQTLTDIEEILSTMVTTSIDETYLEDATEEDINNKITVSSQEFNGQVEVEEETGTGIPMWMYITAGGLLVAVIVLLFILMRRNSDEEEWVDETSAVAAAEVPDLPDDEDSEQATRRKQLEKLAKENPEEFSKLLRTWLSDD